MKNALYLSVITLLLGGCWSTEVANSSDVNQQKIHQSYTVTINDNTHSASVKAQFRFGGSLGTTLNLTKPSDITCNDESLRGDDAFLQGYVYTSNVSNAIQDYKFVFTNTEKKVYSNSIHINPIALGNDTPPTIHKTHNTELHWLGAPVGENETVTIYITGDNVNANFSTSVRDASSIKITADDLRNTPQGIYSVYFERQVSKSCKEVTEEKGTMYATYASEQIRLKIDSTAFAL